MKIVNLLTLCLFELFVKIIGKKNNSYKYKDISLPKGKVTYKSSFKSLIIYSINLFE